MGTRGDFDFQTKKTLPAPPRPSQTEPASCTKKNLEGLNRDRRRVYREVARREREAGATQPRDGAKSATEARQRRSPHHLTKKITKPAKINSSLWPLVISLPAGHLPTQGGSPIRTRRQTPPEPRASKASPTAPGCLLLAPPAGAWCAARAPSV